MPVAALDSDGLIKLAKSGLLEMVCKQVSCVISEQVWKEAVVRGKERFYEDAFVIEALIADGAIAVKAVVGKEVERTLGEGEVATWRLWSDGGIDFIVSDDRRFLSWLEEKGVPFVTPTELIAALAKARKLSKTEAWEGLEKIKGIISEAAFEAAKRKLR
jgi:hypothetical protein